MTVPSLASLPSLTPRRRRLMVFASAAIAIFIWSVVAYLAAPYDWNGLGTGHDARPYWTAIFDHPYLTSRVGDHDAYLYSPAFLQLIAPLRALPWQGFMAAWEIVLMIATLLMVGPVLLGVILVVTLPELLGGNISLLLAAAIVFGFRWPATWSFVLLTKVTPGIGLIWFGVRREWRNLTIALGATAAVIGLSILTTRTGVWTRLDRGPLGQRHDADHVGLTARAAAAAGADRGAGHRLGRPHEPPLDRAGRLPPGAAGDLVRQPGDPGGSRSTRRRAVDSGALGDDDTGGPQLVVAPTAAGRRAASAAGGLTARQVSGGSTCGSRNRPS